MNEPKRRPNWLALILIVICLLGIGLVVRCYVDANWRGSLARASDDWQVTGRGITRGIGGLSLFRRESKRASFLAVFDSKLPGEPRLAVVDLEEGKSPAVRDLNWPSIDWPVDLEALARMPGDASLFFAVTSGGQLWRLRVQADEIVELLGVSDMPLADAPQLEGFDIQRMEGKLVAVWAGRSDGTTAAALCVGVYDEATGKSSLTHRVEFRAPWPDQPTVRHISDLRVDPFGVIFVTSNMDPGNDGPFDSALYVAGTVVFANGSPMLHVNDAPVRLRTYRGRKVEALEFVPGLGTGMVLGSDDENYGGAVLPMWGSE
jgi:hypothetical protein